jgi:uncharacterized membrane protein YeaQ/YmgE (transglycosylase-associated protein family)
MQPVEGKTMIDIIGAIIGGFFVGVLARWFYPGTVPMSGLATILLGIAGALVAGAFASWRRGGTVGHHFNRVGCLASLLGAMLLIFIGRQLGWG